MSDLRTASPASLNETPDLARSVESGTAIEVSLIEPRPGSSIRPFEFRATDEELADLRRRILSTRWPERETVDDDTQGVQLATAQKLAHYWAHDYRGSPPPG